MLFPDGLAGLGATPQAGLDALAGDGLLDVNPLTPLRRVVEVDGRHGAPLTLEASRHLVALLGETPLVSERPVRNVPRPHTAASPGRDRVQEPAMPTDTRDKRQSSPPADPDPARTLVERIRACDPALRGGVSSEDGWLCINRETVREWAHTYGMPPYVLIRTLGHLPGCRVTPDGGLRVREEP